MPINQPRNKENLDEYLLLRNAGVFMVEMLRRRVDLILHGHKHHPAAAKAVYFDGANGSDAPSWVAVVAGGSACKEKEGAMYNLVMIRNSGEIAIDRRSYNASSYESITPRTRLISYQEARAARFARLARHPEFQLRLDGFTRSDEIVHTGGDNVTRVIFKNARSNSENELERYPMPFRSSTGYFLEPKFDSKHVRWQPDPEKTKGSVLAGDAIFNPSLRQDSALTFTRAGRFPNAMYFSQRDRSAATGEPKETEDISVKARFVCDRLTMTVTFPPDCLPPSEPRLIVLDPNEKREYAEESYGSQFLMRLEPSRTFVFSIDRPLPGHIYRMEWELPEEDPTEPPDTNRGIVGTIREIRKRLAPAVNRGQAVMSSLQKLQDEFRAAQILCQFGAADEIVDFSLFVYDDAKNGLVCTHTTITAKDDPILTKVIPPGRDLVGQAYRRRKRVLYVADSGSEAQPYTDTPRTAVLAVPLFYPILKGRRAAIVSLASTSNVTWLAHLQGDEALAHAIAEQITSWWTLFLKNELGLPHVLER